MATLRRIGVVLAAILFAAGFLGGSHYYVALRLVDDSGLPAPWRVPALCGIALGMLLLVLQPIGERKLPRRVAIWIAWPASLWMGFAFFVLVQLLASDFLLFSVGSVASAASGEAVATDSASGLRAGLVVCVALVASAWGLRRGLAPPEHVRVEIALPRWPAALDGFRIAQISDIHIGPILDRRFAAHITERVNAMQPDLIAVTGDLVDGDVVRLADEVEPFRALSAPQGVFFVTGNHDHMSDAPAWVSRAAELGMRVLRNERVAIETRGARFDLVGVDDHRGDVFGGEGGEDLDAALAGRDPDVPAVLLAHDPSTFKRAHARSIDLQISGHTHGGQIFPFNAFVRVAIPFVGGRYGRGDAELYVSRGTGFWGPPMRLGTRAEITEIVLRAGR